MEKNTLMTVSDIELAQIENQIKERAATLATKDGKAESEQWVLKMFDYLQNSGYKLPDCDKRKMAVVYSDQLKDAITVYGYDSIAYCVREWIKGDTYRRFPNAGIILSKVHELCGNPLAEVARRNHEAEVRQMIECEKEKLLKNVTDEQMERLERKYKHE